MISSRHVQARAGTYSVAEYVICASDASVFAHIHICTATYTSKTTAHCSVVAVFACIDVLCIVAHVQCTHGKNTRRVHAHSDIMCSSVHYGLSKFLGHQSVFSQPVP